MPIPKFKKTPRRIEKEVRPTPEEELFEELSEEEEEYNEEKARMKRRFFPGIKKKQEKEFEKVYKKYKEIDDLELRASFKRYNSND